MKENFCNKVSSIKDICHELFEIEDSLDLIDIEIGGVKVWQYLRMPIYYEIAQKTKVLDDPHPFKPSILGWFKIGFSLVKGFIFHNPFLFKGPVDFLLIDHHRSKYLDGEWIDIYTQTFLQKKKKEGVFGLVLEQPHNGLHLRRPSRSRRHLDFVLLFGLISQWIRPYSPNPDEVLILNKINKNFQRNFGFDINIAGKFCKAVAKFRTRYSLYRKLLQRIRPKELYVLVGYGYLGDLIRAAKDLDIPVAEIQHGVISRYHLGYSFPDRREHLSYFPDRLLTWGGYWSDIPELPLPTECLEPYGFDYFHQMRKRYNDITRQSGRVLVLSQGVIGRQLAEKFEGVIGDLDSFEVIYKLHPSEYDYWRDYPALVSLANRPNVTVLDRDVDLYQLFAEAEYQIGVFSTAIFEGIGMGCKTILFDLPGIEYMDRLLLEKFAILHNGEFSLCETLSEADTLNQQQLVERLFGLPS